MALQIISIYSGGQYEKYINGVAIYCKTKGFSFLLSSATGRCVEVALYVANRGYHYCILSTWCLDVPGYLWSASKRTVHCSVGIY